MSNTELMTVKDLIQQKRYDEARALLKTINHPTATKWLAKLDEVSPEANENTIHSATRTPTQIPWFSGIGTIVIVFLIVMVVYQQVCLNNLISYVGGLESDISNVRTSSVSTQTTDSLATRIQKLETDNSSLSRLVSAQGSDLSTLDTSFSDLVRVVNSHASDINSLSYDLSNVSAIANNANRYAHSHDSFSDMRLKTDITQIDNPLERILSLRGVAFMWNTQAFPNLHLEEGRDYGVLAQDVKAVFPELVTLDAESGMYKVDYQGLIPILIESIRQQEQQINELKLILDQSDS